MNLKFPLFILATSLLLFACKGNTGANTNPNTTDSTRTSSTNNIPVNVDAKITGTYFDGDGPVEAAADRVGTYLAVEQLGTDSLKFELTIVNGEPNFHSGSAAGVIPIKDNVAIFATKEFAGECQIIFTFKDKEVELNQAKGGDFDCGFGQGVMAYGTLKKQKNEAIFQYEGGF